MSKINKSKKQNKFIATLKRVNYGAIAQTLFVIVLVLLASLLVLTKINTPLKIRAFSVDSGSMIPTLPIGSLIVVRPSPDYVAGDIVTFTDLNSEQRVVTHRIVSVNTDPDINSTEYVTKGDANEDTDVLMVPKRLVLGKVLFKLPYLGHVSNFAKTQMGFMFLIVIPATILIFSELQNIKREISNTLKNRKKLNKVSNIVSANNEPITAAEVSVKKNVKKKSSKETNEK